MCDVWCVMCDVWYMMYDVWCVMYDVWCMTCDVWGMMYDVWCVMYDVWCVMCDVYDPIWIGSCKPSPPFCAWVHQNSLAIRATRIIIGTTSNTTMTATTLITKSTPLQLPTSCAFALQHCSRRLSLIFVWCHSIKCVVSLHTNSISDHLLWSDRGRELHSFRASLTHTHNTGIGEKRSIRKKWEQELIGTKLRAFPSRLSTKRELGSKELELGSTELECKNGN